jgi:hypothetical protein
LTTYDEAHLPIPNKDFPQYSESSMSMGSLFLFVNSISRVQVFFVSSNLMRKKIQYPEKRIFSLPSENGCDGVEKRKILCVIMIGKFLAHVS